MLSNGRVLIAKQEQFAYEQILSILLYLPLYIISNLSSLRLQIYIALNSV